ncbi:MAG: PQQ-dependent sugar dehydrogenase [Sphingomonadaceae bacterium]|nr:PQQ-dependent sugar dehydrogenase [Altererythrobacter sp.]MCP5390712.1 PQQ-dependent sugar dehydrogenase [Sphingomonadaceae bacterium]MCP5393779.1 PQQ-dependent sugar dehydrogenase [Sphingomonadaceae bacterium]
MTHSRLPFLLSPLVLTLASCGHAVTGESGKDAATAASEEAAPAMVEAFDSEHVASFDNPWAIEFEPGTGRLFIMHRDGKMSFRWPDGRTGKVSGAPEVDYGGQGGLGDLVFAPDYETSGTVYLSWVENGGGRNRGAVVGMAKLACESEATCTLEDVRNIWEQAPKMTGQGHYSHRLAISPDGKHLFVTSGERQAQEPAQDNGNNLGTVVRLDLDGAPSAGNPFAGQKSPTDQIWSYGHRNALGIAFAPDGKLWAVEHGPAGGDELNLIEKGKNYGWPLVSDGTQYGGAPIPSPTTRPDLAVAAVSWTPVIAPSDMIIYEGDLFNGWQGNALITGLKSRALIRVKIDGDSAKEIARYPLGDRMRSIAEASDGAIWVIEEGQDAHLLRLTPKK